MGGSLNSVNIMIIDEDAQSIAKIERMLNETNVNIIGAKSGSEAIGYLPENELAVILMDAYKQQKEGFRTAEMVRMSAGGMGVPIVFVTPAVRGQKFIFQGYNTGAVDYIFRPVQPAILRSKIEVFAELFRQRKQLEGQLKKHEAQIRELSELREAVWRFETLSMVDCLTEVPNRRNFNHFFEKKWREACLEKKCISLIIIDIDYFKMYNDNYGHLKGDECLAKVASLIVGSISRPLDFVARYGGEEFVVVLPETSLDGAIAVADRIKNNIEEARIEHSFSKIERIVTVSLGVSCTSPDEEDAADAFFETADKALYQAKISGRNMVSFR